MLSSRSLLSTIVFSFLFGQMAICLQWKSQSYYANPVKQNAVGSTIFDPTTTSECFGTNETIVINLVSCPYNTTQFFTDANNKIILAMNYNVYNYSTYLPECIVLCNDSVGATAYSWLTIQILGANMVPPVWSNFSTTFNLTSLEPLQYLLATPATDNDIDKTSDGRVSYLVKTVDGAPQPTDYFVYANGGNSSQLLIFHTPMWNPGSSHKVVIAARDNPKTGRTYTITNTITILVSGNAVTVTGYTTPLTSTSKTSTSKFTTTSTGTTNTGTTNTATTTTNTATTTMNTGSTITGSTTTSNSTSCDNILLCDNNWVWLIVGIGALLLAVGVFLALFFYFRHRDKLNVHPSRGGRQGLRSQRRSPGNNPRSSPHHPNNTESY